jgi:hypothetical protein
MAYSSEEAAVLLSRHVWSDSGRRSCSDFVKFGQYCFFWHSVFNMTPQKEVIWGESWEMVGGNGRALYKTSLDTPVIARCGTL